MQQVLSWTASRGFLTFLTNNWELGHQMMSWLQQMLPFISWGAVFSPRWINNHPNWLKWNHLCMHGEFLVNWSGSHLSAKKIEKLILIWRCLGGSAKVSPQSQILIPLQAIRTIRVLLKKVISTLFYEGTFVVLIACNWIGIRHNTWRITCFMRAKNLVKVKWIVWKDSAKRNKRFRTSATSDKWHFLLWLFWTRHNYCLRENQNQFSL